MSKPRSDKVVYWTEKYHLYRERAEQLERENDEIQLRILTLKLENEVLHADFVNANGRCDMQMKENAALREALIKVKAMVRAQTPQGDTDSIIDAALIAARKAQP